MKHISNLILCTIIGSLAANAEINWKMHPTFEEEVSHVVETPGYVYFTSRNMAENVYNDTYFSLFRYDKAGDEILPMSTDNLLRCNLIYDIIFNANKGYLAVLDKDFNIELLHNNGTVTHIPFYSMTSLSYPKTVNGMTIDPSHDRLYLATDFGYVAVNDKKGEIAESRIYGEPLNAFARVGDTYLMIHDSMIKYADANSQRMNLEDYNNFYINGIPESLYPISDKLCLLKYNNGSKSNIKLLFVENGEIKAEDYLEGPIYNIEYNTNGLTIATGDRLYQVAPAGNLNHITRPADFLYIPASSDNMTEVWFGDKRKGLASVKLSGESWTVTRNYMLPNAPAVFAATSFAQHPSKGLLVLTHGYTPATFQLSQGVTMELSGYDNGRWTNYAPAYTLPERTSISHMTNGMAVDPDNPNLVYITSVHNGIIRLNLNDPTDIIQMTRANDENKKYDSFVELLPVSPVLPGFANFSPPYFDNKGNMWMVHPDFDDSDNPNPHLFCWLAEDRRATTSAANARLPKEVEVEYRVNHNNSAYVVPLKKTGNGLLVYVPYQYDETLLLVDTNGTPHDTSDDKVYSENNFYDADGNKVEVRQAKFVWEDPYTGYVWVGHLNGLFYFIPSQVVAGDFHVNRVKVSRNDGTNLADYLLEGVTVNGMTSDSEGRKWFATSGAGIICTSSDGREIIMEFNTANSPLPDDAVYGIGYNPKSNSLMISTAGGLAEYSLPASETGSGKTDVRVYPNPVRPGFQNYVTITDIPEGALIKIVDSGGNLVKELGTMSGFEIQWDLSDSSFKRVRSGVYYILASPSSEGSSFSKVGKILVVS